MQYKYSIRMYSGWWRGGEEDYKEKNIEFPKNSVQVYYTRACTYMDDFFFF